MSTPIRVIVEALAGDPDPSIEQIDALSATGYRILNALISAGHLPVPDCGDCGVAAGQPHSPGCDVELCKNCGWQAIACGCPGEEDDHTWHKNIPSTIWTGRWPGEIEVEEYGLKDLNELASLGRQGLMKWDSAAERWVRQ